MHTDRHGVSPPRWEARAGKPVPMSGCPHSKELFPNAHPDPDAAPCPSHTSCRPLQVPDSPAAFGVLQLGQPGVSSSATGIKLFLEARCWLPSSLQVTESGHEGSQKYSSELNKKKQKQQNNVPSKNPNQGPSFGLPHSACHNFHLSF